MPMNRPLALGAIALLVVAVAADEPTQTIEAAGLSFQAPAAWKKGQPSSAMRKAQLRVEPAEGDKEPAELVVFVFPGGAGTARQNVERWQNQFKGKDGRTPEVESKTVKGRNTDVTRVETAGTYTDPFSRAGARPGFRLLGAIVVTPEVSYFLKMVGPDKTMQQAERDFDALIKSLEVKAE